MKFEHEWIENAMDSIDVVNTRNAYKQGLVRFWNWYIEQKQPDLTIHVMNRFKRFLQDKGYSTMTIGLDISGFKFALDLSARPKNLEERLDIYDIMRKLTIKQCKSDNYSVSLSVEERDQILATCPPTRLKGIRDLAILTMLFYTGPRRSEVAKLDLKDYDRKRGIVSFRETKHHKNRTLPLHDLVIERLDTWLEVRGRVATCDALFVNVMKHTKGKRLTGENIYQMMKVYCEKAGIDHYHPHDCRSTYITMLHDNGVPIGDIQVLAGHSSADTTLGYVRHDLSKLRQSVQTLK